MGILTNKVALVIGGASGIGLAIARRFSSEGAATYITGRRQRDLDVAVAQIGGLAHPLLADAGNPEQLLAAIEAVRVEQGRIDTLVINAGIAEPATLDAIDADHFDRHMTINLRTPVFAVQAAVPTMPSGGTIVLIGSIAGFLGTPAFGTYGATKAALRAYARTWTNELASKGLRVNVVSPGPTDTAMFSSVSDEMRDSLTKQIPLGRLARADEIAAAALFLASGESSFVAGIELCVDGGMAQV